MPKPSGAPARLANPWTVEPDAFPATSGTADQLRFLLNYAVLAPSGHNTQPWLFDVEDGVVDVLADRRRRLPVVDPDDRELTISCAAAAKTLVLAARQFGVAAALTLLPEGPGADVIARVEVTSESDAPRSRAVLDAIKRRRTTRTEFAQDNLPVRIRADCAASAKRHGIQLAFAGDAATHDAIADLVAEGDRRQFNDPDFRRELAEWIRPRMSPQRDGLSGVGFGLPDALLGAGAFMIRTFDIGGAAASGDARRIREGTPLFMVLSSGDDTPADWAATGCALGEILTTLSARGWTVSYLNQPIEVPDLRPKLRDALGIGQVPQMLMRVGRAKLPPPAARRPVKKVLVAKH